MTATEHPLQALATYLPEKSFDLIEKYLHQYKVHLTVTKERKTLLGDYRNASHRNNHRITVNGTLNKYAFLITLIHELAHLLTYEKFGHKVNAHGNEWKNSYSNLLTGFAEQKIFPEDIFFALKKSFNNPAASSCAEVELTRVLRKYDNKKNGIYLIEELQAGEKFITKDKRIFLKGEKLRKRFRCTEIKTGIAYLFSPVYEVRKV
ncbi:MAG: SprT-like domain-containing protein [Chitinophagaceae bacterium]